jgi:HD superfamily phosphodiesterase
MLSKEEKDKLDAICLKYYLNRDKSHGIDHIQKVLKNVNIISKQFDFSSREVIILRTCSLLHDAYDHKYFQKDDDIISIKQKISIDLTKFGLSWNEIQVIFIIIDNISFSKEKNRRAKKKYRYSELDELLSSKMILIRNIVSDADKIEALGVEGISRMILYSIHKTKNIYVNEIVHDIKQLCENKLYILLSQNYIHTESGVKLTSNKLEELKKITENDEILQEFVQTFLEKNKSNKNPN